MKIVSNELKNALKQPTTQRKGRILVNGNYYEVYNVEYYADAYNEGNVIGNAIASQLDFDLPYMDKFETFKYYDGVWTGTKYEYVDFGTFTVFDEQDEDEFNKHITAFDNLIKFNQPFKDVGGYPKSLYQELKNICNQAEVELENTNIPNGNFIVENNQFVEGENLKSVLKAIEQISGTYGIIKNDKLVLQLKNQTTEKINKNEHEPITWKRRTYGINQVVLGMEDVQGEYVLRQDDEDIAINGVHKLVVNDNPFVYTQLKREQVIDALFNEVKGFGYVPYDLKMEWLNYMDIGDTITIDGVETLILRMYGKSPKSLESEMSAPAIIDSAIEYSNNTYSLYKRVSRTEFGVDKNAREIQGIVETTEKIEKEINPTKQETGSLITIEDASDNPLIELEIEGKSTQKTRSGKNLYNYKDTISTLNGITTDDNGWITATYDNTSGTSEKYLQYFTNNLNIKTNTNYLVILEIKAVNGSGRIHPVSKTTNEGQFPDGTNYQFSSLTDNTIKTQKSTSRETFDGITGGLRTVLAFAAGQSGSITFRLSVLEDTTITSDTFEYEAFGVSPSPNFPSEIESVGYENLFDKDNANVIDGYFHSTSSAITSNSTRKIIYIPVKSNTTYTIKTGEKITTSNMFAVGYTNELPTLGVTVEGIDASSTTPKTITTGENAIYLVAFIYRDDYAISYDEVLESLQIEEGSTIHPYIPYGKYGVEIKTVTENILPNNGISQTIYGVTFTVNSDKSITMNGTATENANFPIFGTGWDYTNEQLILGKGTYFTIGKGTNNAIVYCRDAINDVNISTQLNGVKITNELALITYVFVQVAKGKTVSNEIIYPRIVKGEYTNNTMPDYKPYQERVSKIVLNAPLRSLPNGVKDIAYIKNNKLYVDRYVGSVVLDGSENWTYYSSSAYPFRTTINNAKAFTTSQDIAPNVFCNYYIPLAWNTPQENRLDYEITSTVSNTIAFRNAGIAVSKSEWLNWLSTHNTRVDYELAQPYTEEIGEIEMSSTFKGINHISTTDDLFPIINLTYVRDTIIADYVEQHVAELKITENEIKESVESVSSSVDGLNTTINRVEEITNDNSQVINVISTNIDKTSGEVREVTTTTGFTFNADGMTIDDGSGFKAEHTANGTYYKDGNSIVGQYTKDGSKQKDLELFGTYSYGKESIDDTPMFVGQLYRDENGEECFGHFYNGGDY